MTMEVLNREGAAAYLKLACNTLDKMRVAGRGPKYAKLGRSVRYRRADLDEYLACNLVASTSEAQAA